MLMSRNGVGDLLVDDPHHLLGRHAVGGQRGDERAGARADVDVELVDRPVDREQVEGAKGADLVDAAGHAAAAEHQGGPGPGRLPRRRGLRPVGCLPLPGFWSLTTWPMSGAEYRSGKPPSAAATCPAVGCSLTEMRRACIRSRAARALMLALPPLRARTGGRQSPAKGPASAMMRGGAVLRRLRPERDRSRTLFKLEIGHGADPGLEHEDVHDGGRARQLGARGHPDDRRLGAGTIEADGTWRGDLYLRGGGDPTFGTASFVAQATAAAGPGRGAGRRDRGVRHHARDRPGLRRRVALRLAARRAVLGLPHVDLGRAAVGAVVQPRPRERAWVRVPVESAGVRGRPPRRALEARDITVRGVRRPGRRRRGAASSRRSSRPPLSRIVRMTLKPSDNFFAEMLLKGLAHAARHDPAGAASGDHARSLGFDAGTARGRLRARTRQPGLAARGRAAARRRCATSRPFDAFYDVAARRRQGRARCATACEPGRPAAAAAPRPARSRRLDAVGLLPRRSRRRPRLLDPDEQRRARRARAPPGPDGPGDRALQRLSRPPADAGSR